MSSTGGAWPGPLVPPGPDRSPNGSLPVGPVTNAPEGPLVESCTRVDTDYDALTTAIVAVYITIGLLYTFFGYRCFKTTMFLTGFIFASSIVYLICLQGDLLPPYGNAVFSEKLDKQSNPIVNFIVLGVAILAGLLFGLITMLVQYVGLFMNGLHIGVLLALAGLVAADHLVNTEPKGSVWLCVGVLLGAALLGAVLNLYFRKGLTVIGTAVYGSALLAAAADYFTERLVLAAWTWQRASLLPAQSPPCWFSWLVLATWPTLALTGVVLQFAFTGHGTHHADVAAGRKKPRGPGVHGVSRVDRAEMKQKKYRYLYQVRTAHGDVISQNFVQQLQKKDNDVQGECSTLQSDTTHLTILPDAQLAALTESEDDSQTEIATRR